MAAKLKKGDKVFVLTGKDQKKTGEIISVNPKAKRAIVGGLNIAVRHQRQTQKSQGGRISNAMPIHLSNLAFLDKNGKPTRVGFKIENGKKVRFAKNTGEIIDV